MGADYHVYVCDFGLALMKDRACVSAGKNCIGPVRYSKFMCCQLASLQPLRIAKIGWKPCVVSVYVPSETTMLA